MVDAVRAAIEQNDDLKKMFSIPKRVITRPPRLHDNLVENSFVGSREEFDAKVQDGSITTRWERKMEGDRIEKYGFEKSEDGHIPIFSANNAITFFKLRS